LSAYIEHIHQKYKNIAENERNSFLKSNSQISNNTNTLRLTRYNSNESIDSIHSAFSQRTCQSMTLNSNAYTMYENYSACMNAAGKSGSLRHNDMLNKSFDQATEKEINDNSKSKMMKKYSWFRNSFKRAFNRKNHHHQARNASASPGTFSSTNGPLDLSGSFGSLSSPIKKCLSDVDENELLKDRHTDFDEQSQHNLSMSSGRPNELFAANGDYCKNVASFYPLP
jgi:hypothetical protein